MLTMAEKTFLGLTLIFSITLTGIVVLPVISSYDVSLVTIPNGETFRLREGEPFNITCKGSGDDVMKFSSLKWLNQQGTVVPKGIPGTQEKEKKSLTLIFTDPKEQDSGVYRCVATYENAQNLQKIVSIVFHSGKPYFDLHFENITAEENSFLLIPCVADGDLPITYEWYNENEDKITENSRASISDYANGTGSALMIPEVTLDDAGVYTCLARNQHGLSSKIFQITVLSSNGNNTFDNDTTISFRNALVLNVTARSVEFAFEVTGKAKYVEVLYGTSQNVNEHSVKCASDDACEIQDLIPAERYIFKFRTIPSNNNQWSRTYEVVLLPDVPEVIFQTIDSGTIKLQWLVKYEVRKRNTIDKHQITYFTVQRQGIDDRWVPSGCRITIQIPECSSSSYTLAGLTQKTYYEIQVRAHTASGYGEPYRQKISNSLFVA